MGHRAVCFLLRTPFTVLPKPSSPKSYEDALLRQKSTRVVMPYCLDVWCGPKVMSVQWSDSGDFEMISFRTGPWETVALALTGPQEATRRV